jgi:DNA-binding LytR/AlgR family response regulator
MEPTPRAWPAALPALAGVRVEKDGRLRLIPISDIYVIRANAHYTFIHDGTQEYFCNQSISVLEAALDRTRFMRVHRSFIVRIDRIARLKRAGDAAAVELGDPVRCSIPVARGQVREVKARIETLASHREPATRASGQNG